MTLSVLLCWGFSAAPQSEGLITTTTEQLSDGRVALSVRNNSQVPLLACLITQAHFYDSGRVGAKGLVVFDAVTDPRSMSPVLPGQAKSFTLGGRRGGKPPAVVLEAAVFLDGTTFGDQAGVRMIVNRRQYILRLAGEALSILEEAADQNMAREQLIARFKTFREEHTKAAPDIEHVLLVNETSDTVLVNLTRGPRGGDRGSVPVAQVVSHLALQLRVQEQDLLRSLPKLSGSRPLPQ